MRHLILFCTIFFCFIISSCRNNETDEVASEIYIDFSNVTDFDLSNAEMVDLQLTDNSMLGLIDEITLYKDTTFLIHSRGSISLKHINFNMIPK